MTVTFNNFDEAISQAQTRVTEAPPPRILGFDLARALALIGMVVVNYELTLGASGKGPEWLATLTQSLQGRAAATFVVLAGIGASLGSKKARLALNTPEGKAQRNAARWTLAKRGVFLFAIGTPFLLIWPADILHFYGIWLLLGSVMLFLPTAALLFVALAFVVGGAMFLLQGEFFLHWNLVSLDYESVFEPAHFVRNLFLNGWHPVVPWIALYLIGMVLGRLNWMDRKVRARLLMFAAPIAIVLHLVEDVWVTQLVTAIEPMHLLATSSFPPTPGFVFACSSISILLILLACEIAERAPTGWTEPLIHTGQLALTLYVGHVIVGLGAIEEMGRLENQSLPFAVTAAMTFSAGAIVFSTLWRRRFTRGPLEWVMRKISS